MPRRRAISAFAIRASRCRKATICRSVSSRVRPTAVRGTSSASREWLMAERISAIWSIIKNVLHSKQIHDEFSSFLTNPFKRHPSPRHPTPGMLTDLAESTIAAMTQPAERDAERDLVARAQRGHVAAFEALYRANSPRVYALAIRLTGDAAQAGELTQDVFVHAWQR